MQTLRNNIQLRYALAIVATTALMTWISVNEEGGRAALPRQATFWSVAVTAGWLQMILIARGVRATLGTERWPGWALLLVTALIGAVPLTFEIRWLMRVIVTPEAGLPPPWLTYLNVTVINLVFCLVQYLLIERWVISDAPQAPVPADPAASPFDTPQGPLPPAPGMLGRPPQGLSGAILYMKMEDHYLVITTTEGHGMTLHRMSDASRDLAESDGMQVHKSWWVARSAVRAIRTENRKRIITATDGTEIPVGRTFEPALRDAGWL